MSSHACTVCRNHIQGKPAVQFEDHSLCASCAPLTAQYFVTAFYNEAAYPPMFDSVSVPISHFKKFFPRGFEAAYQLKEIEYAVPAQDRLYCPHKVGVKFVDSAMNDQICSAFLGARSERTGEKIQCKTCHGFVCTHCHTDNALATEKDMHTCTKIQPSDSLHSPTRMIDYQALDRKDSVNSANMHDGKRREQDSYGHSQSIREDDGSTDDEPRAQGLRRKSKKQGGKHLKLDFVAEGNDGQKEFCVLVRRIHSWETKLPGEGAVLATADLKWARDIQLFLHVTRQKVMAEYKQHLRSGDNNPGPLMATYHIARRVNFIAAEIAGMDAPVSRVCWQASISECKRHARVVKEILGTNDNAMVEWWSQKLDSATDLVLSRLQDIAEAQVTTRSGFPQPAARSDGGNSSSWVHRELVNTRLKARCERNKPAASSKGRLLWSRLHGIREARQEM